MWSNLLTRINLEAEAIRQGVGRSPDTTRKTAGRVALAVFVLLVSLWMCRVMAGN